MGAQSLCARHHDLYLRDLFHARHHRRSRARAGIVGSHPGLCGDWQSRCLRPFWAQWPMRAGGGSPGSPVLRILLALSTAALWFGKPGRRGPWPCAGVAAAVAVSPTSPMTASLVFHGAMLPWLAPAQRIGRWSGAGLCARQCRGHLAADPGARVFLSARTSGIRAGPGGP